MLLNPINSGYSNSKDHTKKSMKRFMVKSRNEKSNNSNGRSVE